MRKCDLRSLLTISTILISIWLVGGLGATTDVEQQGTNNLSDGANVTLGGTEFMEKANAEPSWLQELLASESCPAASAPGLDLLGPQQASSCVPYGHVCDPIYVPGAVCCPGTNCIKPYPGVPKYCL